MTLPVNRFKPLCDTRAFLLLLRDDAELPEHVRQRAHAVLKHRPSERELRTLAEPALISTRVSRG